jgi:TRAP-type C4-dicarboxylate transport system permease small subunit
MVFVAAGIFALFNIVIAGFQYMTAGGDSKAMTEAWSRIWLTLVGLILMVGAFVLAAIFGFLLFGDATFMLQPRIYTP